MFYWNNRLSDIYIQYMMELLLKYLQILIVPCTIVLYMLHIRHRFKPSSKIFYSFFMSCVCYTFVRVYLYVHCGHLLGKG